MENGKWKTAHPPQSYIFTFNLLEKKNITRTPFPGGRLTAHTIPSAENWKTENRRKALPYSTYMCTKYLIFIGSHYLNTIRFRRMFRIVSYKRKNKYQSVLNVKFLVNS